MGKLGRPFALSREQIGAAVVELGLDTFSMKDLASHLGVTEKTLYNYAEGKLGLLALGMETAMRSSPEAPRVVWTDETDWRTLLRGVGEEAWRFMSAVPGVGVLIVQGVHSRAEAEYAARAGKALVGRGFTDDQALEALTMVFDLVTTAFATSQRMHTRAGDGERSVQEQIALQIVPEATAEERGLFDASARAIGEPREQMLQRRLTILLEGFGHAYGIE